MNYILFDKKKKVLYFSNKKNVHKDLYYLKANVPTEINVKEYLENKNKDQKIAKFFEINGNVNKQINNIKKNISKIDNYRLCRFRTSVHEYRRGRIQNVPTF